ncbi:hypothetical protein H0262_06760 [Psychrobacter cryohalolentis]|uniref:hypothetical protein n=1 Tax=Psychrobacter sp. D2 TaxID=2759702 RepID=UPI0015E5A06D|nr:hypothetical protein [Psychrobacter sp. D2]MBA2057580.1 hypothetical protein [Psychrobacter sp. D2]
MKPNLFKYSVLSIGIVSAMGITATAIAAESSVGSAPTINNVATATYNIGNVAQTPVISNTVTVNITQSAAFSLTADNADGNTADDFNKNLAVTPQGRVLFEHTLTNTGNIEDSYKLALSQGGNIPGITPQNVGNYDLTNTNVTYVVYNANNVQIRSITVAGTNLQNSSIALKPSEYAKITISAKTANNVGGALQNLTLTAESAFIATAEPSKAVLTNVDNSTTKLPVFKIDSSIDGTLDLNNPNDVVTYIITVTNDGTAPYSTDAQGITVISNLPAGLRLANSPNASVSNNASINTGKGGAGTGSANDSITVTLLNLPVGDTATIRFDVQRDADESSAIVKGTVNHAIVKLDLGADSGIMYDTTDSTDSNQNTALYYPTTHDSERTDGIANSAIGGDSAAPLTANQRAFSIAGATKKEIPTTTSSTTLVTHSAVITNTGKEVEGDQLGELKFTITPEANNKVIVVAGSVELVYDPDGNPNTNNSVTYTITSDANGDYDIVNANPGPGAPAWTGMSPGSTATINYKTQSTNAALNTTENIIITVVPGGTDAPTITNNTVKNETTVKGLVLNKQQALNIGCQANAILTFSANSISAQPGNCIVYKISAFNNFSTADSRFTFTNTVISDAISQFANKAMVLTTATTPSFEIKLDDIANATATPLTNKYSAALDTNKVGGTVTSLAPQNYAAMMFAVRINPEGAEVNVP